MKCLFIGDIVGRSGRAAVKKHLSNNKYDFVCANIENSAAGFGITNKVYLDLQKSGINAMTAGNHTWDKKDILEHIDKWDLFIRPANLCGDNAGVGYRKFVIQDKVILVINLIGRVFLNEENHNPFTTFDEIYNSLSDEAFIIVDFHGEATSEKIAFGHYVTGRANVVTGSHTHVQTNDLKLLSDKTLYLTDAGMCGGVDSILGMTKEPIINRFLDKERERFSVELLSDLQFNGFSFTINDDNTIKDFYLINEVYEK